jgi:hypothetical protein
VEAPLWLSVAKAERVFIGVTGTAQHPRGERLPSWPTRVQWVFKGDVPERLAVTHSDSTCDYTYTDNSRYVIFSRHSGHGVYRARICEGTTEMPDSRLAQLLFFLKVAVLVAILDVRTYVVGVVAVVILWWARRRRLAL